MIAESFPPLPREFYMQETLVVARRLLNCLLVHQCDAGLTVGRITETEAYRQDDPACHAFKRRTLRNAAMFGPPGHAYMYLNYGLHWCFNAVTQAEGTAEAVLVRALEPVVNWELMATRRGLTEIAPASEDEVKRGRFLCGGPGKLTVAMGIGPNLNHHDLVMRESLWIASPLPDTGNARDADVIETTRVGITRAADYPWRFYLRNDPYISKK